MVHVIWVKVIDSSMMNTAESRIKEILRKQHKIRQGKEDDFKIHNLEEIRNTVSQSIGIFTSFFYQNAHAPLPVPVIDASAPLFPTHARTSSCLCVLASCRLFAAAASPVLRGLPAGQRD